MRSKGDSELVPVNEAARRLGLTGGEVSRLHQLDGCPKLVRSGRTMLKWPDFPRWRDARLKREGKPATLDASRARRAAAQAELSEIEVAKARGEVLTIADLERIVAKDYGMVKAGLLSLPGRLAPEILGLRSILDAQAVVDRRVREIMAELSR
jgi:hypothetical protein